MRVINEDMNRLALSILTDTLFGVDLDADTGEHEAVLGSVLGFFGDPLNSLVLPSWLPTPANLALPRECVRVLDAWIARLSDQRRTQLAQGHPGNDLLSRLLVARDESGDGMSERQRRDELITLAFAGHKTTAATLTDCFWLLAQHPDVDEQLAVEGGRSSATGADRGPTCRIWWYTEAVIKETLRLFPPSWGIGREGLRDGEIAGYSVLRGTQLLLVQWVVHTRRPVV